MSFFDLYDGEKIEQSGVFSSVEAFEPIPHGTQLKAFIEQANWAEYDGEQYINLKWVVIEGDYKGRKVFQKVKTEQTDKAKRDKAIRMLAAIDTNAGGGLQRGGVKPDDMSLQFNLCNKPMAIQVLVWKIDDKQGNYISAVAPLNRQQAQPQQQPQASGFNAPF